MATSDQTKTDEQINKTIRKDVEKIVDKYDIEELVTQCNTAQNKTISYCRCWKSKKVSKFLFDLLRIFELFSFLCVMDRIMHGINKQVIILGHLLSQTNNHRLKQRVFFPHLKKKRKEKDKLRICSIR